MYTHGAKEEYIKALRLGQKEYRELETRLGDSLLITDNPDLCGALGAALFAFEDMKGHE